MTTPKERKASISLPANTVIDTVNPREVTTAELKVLLQQPGHVEVIDVRPPEEFAQSHIDGSVNRPFQDLDFGALAQQLKAAPQVARVFVSAQSPDLDDLAARELIGEYQKREGAAPPEGSVGVLLGGLYTWVNQSQ